MWLKFKTGGTIHGFKWSGSSKFGRLACKTCNIFIQRANEFKSSIWVEKDERRVNAKSLLGVLSLGIVKGTSISIIADGSDEEEAVKTLVELIESNFSE